MSQSAPSNGRWIVDPSQQGVSSLRWDADAAAATAADLGPEDVLVDLRAASLNFRDVVVTKAKVKGFIPLPVRDNVVPGSDGAGVVVAVGSAVPSGLRPGMRVVAHLAPHVLPEDRLPDNPDIHAGLGCGVDGTLLRRGRFHWTALAEIPGDALSFEEAASLTCSGLTAWNTLFGLRGREVRKGDWVLVQGTGGVSVTALQIAVSEGATVVATTSSDAKAAWLRELGASHVLNYRADPDWGKTARALTPDGRGFDHVVDVGGQATLGGAFDAVRLDGLVTAVGIIAGFDFAGGPGAVEALNRICIVRGIKLGSRDMLRDMLAWFVRTGVRPALDNRVFSLEQANEAYERLEKGEHVAKVVIKIA